MEGGACWGSGGQIPAGTGPPMPDAQWSQLFAMSDTRDQSKKRLICCSDLREVAVELLNRCLLL